MGDIFYSIDLSVFYFLNHTISTPILDKFFVFITDVNHWYIAYVILLGVAFFKGGRTGKIAAITALIVVGVSDQISSAFLKDLFARIRPCNALPDVNLLVGCTGSYSMPSSHAVNNFAVAVFFLKLYPKLKWVLLTTATIVALSRPYVGVHYPSDIIVGAIIGSIIGYLFALLVMRLNKSIRIVGKDTKYERVYPDEFN
jgi:undecaprenyl-diphosphatase